MNRKFIFKAVLFLVLVLVFPTTNVKLDTPFREISSQTSFPTEINLQTLHPLASNISKSFLSVDPLPSRVSTSFFTQEDYVRISIEGNKDFHTQANEKNWPGNGSVNNTLITTSNVMNTIHFILVNSSHNSLINNTLNNGRIVLRNSPHNSLINNTLINSIIKISGSTLGDVLQTEVSNNSIDSYPLVFEQNITGGTLHADVPSHLILINCPDVEIDGQILLLTQFIYCKNLYLHDNLLSSLQLTNCSDFTFQNNTITMETSYSPGILLDSSSNNQIMNNTITDTQSSTGIEFFFSDNNSLVNNTIVNSTRGIILTESRQNSLINNFIALEEPYYEGIELSGSKNTTILDNQLFGCRLSFFGIDIDDYLQVEANNNFIDGKSLIFWKSRSNNSVPADVKQIFLVNCSFIEVSHHNFSDLLGFLGISCSNLFIHDNDITESGRIYLDSTNDSLVTHNTLTYIRLERCSSNIISYNTLDSLYMAEGGYNTVLGNNFDRSGLTIHISHLNNISSNSVINGRILIDGANRNLISNNSVFTTTYWGTYGEGGIVIVGTGHNRIIGNYVSNSLGDGIVVGFANSHHAYIMGNKFVNNAGYGVSLMILLQRLLFGIMILLKTMQMVVKPVTGVRIITSSSTTGMIG
jgi:parallel beta-helix repeat protein